jgi:hypothetical protein
MVYFYPEKNKHRSALRLWFANHGIIIINHGQPATIIHDNFSLEQSYIIISLYILEQPTSWSTSQIRPSWPQSRVELRLLLLCFVSILLVSLGPPSISLFTPTTQV